MTSLYDQAYSEYLEHSHDPVWRLAMEIYLGEVLQEMASYHHGQIQAVADKHMYAELGQVRKALTKQYLTARIEEVRKAGPKKQFQEHNWRRQHGRFSSYVGPGQAFGPNGGKHPLPGLGSDHWSTHYSDPQSFLRENLRRRQQEALENDKPLSQRQISRALLGMKNGVELPALEGHQEEVKDAQGRVTGYHMVSQPGANLSQDQHRNQVLQRAADMTNDLYRMTGNESDKQRVQYVIQSPDGSKRIEVPKAGKLPNVNYAHGERVHYMTPVGPDNPVHVGGQALNLGLVAGMSPEQAARVGGVTQGIHDTLGQTTWGKKMQSVAGAVAAISGNHPAAAQAHAFASMVNLIGPQASRAFGGKLRQLTYRYTGQENAPEDYSALARKGKGENEPTAAFELRLAKELAEDGAIPTTTEYAASLKSGSTPPSHGYILDRKGKVVSQAVGMSDDWYTPFNLRKLPNLKGGTYVRTRAYGGLTPEDIRVAMRTGAHRVTVVSNNGVFSMEFNPKALHWGHRWGFGGAAMVRRYTKSLDAIKNGEIQADVEGSNKLELNSRGYQAAMDDLRMKYPYWVKHPKLTPMEAFHKPLGGPNGVGLTWRGQEAQGDRTELGNYVSPLNTRARDAMHGWYEKGVGTHSMWEDPQTGKVAYNDMDRYQVHHDSVLNAHRMADLVEATSEAGKATTTTGGKVPTGPQPSGGRPDSPRSGLTNQQARDVQGAGQAERQVDENKVDEDAVDDWMRSMRKVTGQAAQTGFFARANEDDPDFQDLLDVFEHADMSKSPKYAKVHGRLANSKAFREKISGLFDSTFNRPSEMGINGDELNKLVIGLQEMHHESPRLQDATDQRQGESEQAASGPNYRTWRHNQDLPRADVDELFKPGGFGEIWHNTRASKQAKDDIALWRKYRAQNSRPKGPATNPEVMSFNRANGLLAQILTDQNRRKAEAKAEPLAVKVERTNAKGELNDGELNDKQVSAVASEKVEPVDTYVARKLKELAGNRPLHDDQVVLDVMEQVNAHNADAKRLSREGLTGGSWHVAAAQKMSNAIEQAIQAHHDTPTDDEDDIDDDDTLNAMEADLKSQGHKMDDDQDY